MNNLRWLRNFTIVNKYEKYLNPILFSKLQFYGLHFVRNIYKAEETSKEEKKEISRVKRNRFTWAIVERETFRVSFSLSTPIAVFIFHYQPGRSIWNSVRFPGWGSIPPIDANDRAKRRMIVTLNNELDEVERKRCQHVKGILPISRVIGLSWISGRSW